MARAKQHVIEKELVEATGLKRRRGEPDADWQERLLRAYSKVDDEAVEDLSDAAYEWCEAGVMALKSSAEIPSYEGGEPEPAEEEEEEEAEGEEEEAEEGEEEEGEEEEEAEEEEEEEGEEEEEPRRPVRRQRKKTTKKASKKKAKRMRSGDGSMVDRHRAMRELVIDNYGLHRDQLFKLGEEAGVDLKRATLSTIVYHTVQTMEMIESQLDIELPKVDPHPKRKKTTARGADAPTRGRRRKKKATKKRRRTTA